MSIIPENKRVSLTECKKILNKNGILYSDDEILEIRKWLYHIAEIILDANESDGSKLNEETNKKHAA